MIKIDIEIEKNKNRDLISNVKSINYVNRFSKSKAIDILQF